MEKPTKEDRKLLTDFFMWMVENDFDHNIRIRVETKAELFLRDRNQKQPEPVSSVMRSAYMVQDENLLIHGCFHDQEKANEYVDGNNSMKIIKMAII